MTNNGYKMLFSREFKDYLSLAEECGQTYVGHGNPNASILIVANEPGVVNDDFIKYDLEKNLEKWKADLSVRSMDNVDVMFDGNHNLVWEKFNPLWPYKGQCLTQIRTTIDSEGKTIILNKDKHPTSRSWIQYQKLVDMIYSEHHECNRQKDDSLDFFERAFITDFSAVYGKSSKEIDPEKRCESIIQRLPLFGSSFISRFPVIIVASGHYIRDIEPLHDLRKVFHGFNKVEMVDDAFGWRNIHYSEDGKRVLIHSMHFASAISDDYLRAIAKVSSPYIKK